MRILFFQRLKLTENTTTCSSKPAMHADHCFKFKFDDSSNFIPIAVSFYLKWWNEQKYRNKMCVTSSRDIDDPRYPDCITNRRIESDSFARRVIKSERRTCGGYFIAPLFVSNDDNLFHRGLLIYLLFTMQSTRIHVIPSIKASVEFFSTRVTIAGF